MCKPIAILGLLITMVSLDADTVPKSATDPFKLEHDADLVIYYHPESANRMMEISSSSSKANNARVIIRKEQFSATSKNLAKYFDDQPRKSLIVIVYEFNKLEDAECMATAARLKDYFVARGYKRISIQQATNGGSRPVYIDYKAEQPGPAQPATQPADKLPVKDQPSPPTSKVSPR